MGIMIENKMPSEGPLKVLTPDGGVPDWKAYRFGKLWSLGTIPKTPIPMEWAVHQIIPKRSLSLFYGAPGHAKSLVVMDMCMCVASGKEWLGRKEFWTAKSKVLWLDLDMGTDAMNERLVAMNAVHGAPGAVFNYYSFPTRGLNLSKYEDVEDLINLVLELGSEIVVVDTFKRVAGDCDENSSAIDLVLGAMRRVISETGCAIIAIHHSNKNVGGAGQTRIRGSTAIAGGIDCGYHIEYVEEADAQARFSLKQEKARRGTPVRPFEFRIESKKSKAGATTELSCKMFEVAKPFVGNLKGGNNVF